MSTDMSVPEQREAGLDTTDSGLTDAVLRDSPAGVAFLGSDMRFAWANPALAQLYGRDQGDFPGHALAEVLPPVDAARAEAAVTRVLAEDSPAVETFAAADSGTGSRR
jgi:PAS domain-containing protein